MDDPFDLTLACGFCPHVGDAQCNCSMIYDYEIPPLKKKLQSENRNQESKQRQTTKRKRKENQSKKKEENVVEKKIKKRKIEKKEVEVEKQKEKLWIHPKDLNDVTFHVSIVQPDEPIVVIPHVVDGKPIDPKVDNFDIHIKDVCNPFLDELR